MNKVRERGFVSWIILSIVALALLKYFLDWSIFDAVESSEGQETISYIRNVVDVVWGYIAEPVMFVWNEIIWPILEFAWQSFQGILEEGRAAGAKFN